MNIGTNIPISSRKNKPRNKKILSQGHYFDDLFKPRYNTTGFSVQNIILQEMEDLDGILIATTNLTCNLDKAFERRFLYKVRFDKPSVEARAKIWRAMMPELSAAEAASLAEGYDFSGGQIENIVRKKTVKSLISGTEPGFEEILSFCREEGLGDQRTQRRIGF